MSQVNKAITAEIKTIMTKIFNYRTALVGVSSMFARDQISIKWSIAVNLSNLNVITDQCYGKITVGISRKIIKLSLNSQFTIVL